MAKTLKKRRVTKSIRSELKAKFLGPEPTLTENSTRIEIMHAYNYYNSIYNDDDAKQFVITYFKSQQKSNKGLIKKLNQIPAWELHNVGWNCRLLSNGSKLPLEIKQSVVNKINKLVQAVSEPEPQEVEESPKVVISIQERIQNKASELIGELEAELDKFYLDHKYEFDASSWFRTYAIKPQIAKIISEYYAPLYAEAHEILNKKDADLAGAYKSWKKPDLKKYVEFIKSIISAAETATVVAKVSRKPRKKKEKPLTVIVQKLRFKEKNDDLNLVSVNPTEIIGCNQLWVYNTKTRVLVVYNALGPVGLGVKGSTLIGFDPQTSTAKMLRKPHETLTKLKEGGKIVLKRLMDELSTKEKSVNGRINKDVILVKVIK